MTTKGCTKRIVEADFLRAISFLMVVLQHSIGAYASRPGISIGESIVFGELFLLAKFAVPMFVFLSGMSLFYTYSSKLNTLKFFKKRVVSILTPYILWTVFYSYYAVYGLPSSEEWGMVIPRIANLDFFYKTLRNTLFGVSYYHMWFVVMIFQFYVLFPFMLGLYRRLRTNSSDRTTHSVLTIINLAWLCLLVIKTYVMPHVTLPLQSTLVFQYILAWSDREFIYYLGYFTLGAQAGLDVHKWHTKLNKVSWVIWLGLVAACTLVSWELFSNLSADYHLNFMVAFTLKPEVALLCLGEILLFYKLSMKIPLKSLLAGVLKLIGKYSFGAYFIHALILQIICLKYIDKFPIENRILATFAAFLFGSVLSVCIFWAWDIALTLLKSLRQLFRPKPQQAGM